MRSKKTIKKKIKFLDKAKKQEKGKIASGTRHKIKSLKWVLGEKEWFL